MFKLSRIRLFLLGILIGQVLMVPHIIRWMNYPVVYAIPYSRDVYSTLPPYQEHIKDVITKEVKTPTPMYITLMNVDEVRAKFKQIYGQDSPNLLGFYFYDEKLKAHFVFCVRSPEVLAHEVRHAFEGDFHRGQQGSLE